MEQSEEIRRVIERWLTALSSGDAEAVLARLSEHPATLLIGTDPNEWWPADTESSRRALRAVWARQIEEMGGFPMTREKLDAWEEGNVGWANGKLSIEWQGERRELRITYVLRLERGEWKVVHAYLSLPQANETIGLAVTTTLQELEEKLQREPPDVSASLAIDGTVTIVFTDIVDSTIMLSRLGDHSWLEVIKRHNAVIRELTDAHGGTVVETQGDGSMLAFSSARRAVSCAGAIQAGVESAFADFSPPIRIRIGIHTGDALHEAEHFFGTTVHFAARIAGHAVGGEILVSSVVRDLVGSHSTSASFLESREVELKGLEGRHRLYALAPHTRPDTP